MTAAYPPTVLVVDDEPGLRALLQQYLSGRGLAVRTAADGSEMRAQLRQGRIDAVLLDVNLPGESGLALLDWLRASGDDRPVILLTSRHELADRVGGVRAGADDYVVKPFEPRELLARLRAVLRRVPRRVSPPPASSPPLLLGQCWFNPAASRLTGADGGEVALTAGEAELLRALLRHPGVTVERARLAELVCGQGGGRGLDAHVLRLRRKLEPDPARPRVLVTRPGSGYALVPGDGAADA
jgi:DNA-binding response OmpR family regulator